MKAEPQVRRARADGGRMPGSSLGSGSYFPYRAADWANQDMGDWLPWIRSPDAEINQFRDRMVARQRDLRRNDGWISGAITKILDITIGSGLKLSAAPDYRALSRLAPGFDAVWANEYRQAAEAIWRGYSDNYGRYNDVSRQMTVGQQQRLAFAHKMTDGESAVVSYWMPDRVGYGRADYATAYLVVDPDRLSNPMQMVDSRYMRSGVELDDYGVPVAYHFRKAHQNDWYNSIESMEWERVQREDDDGWQRVLHDFDRDRAGQNRGVSILAPIVSHAKMLAAYYGVEMQAALTAATLGTYVTSPYDPDQVAEMLGGDDAELSAYQQLRGDFHKERPVMFNGVQIPSLAPGESITSVAAGHPHNGFPEFTSEMQLLGAAATGLTDPQYSGKWFRMNYSSARAGVMDAWKTVLRRRDDFTANTCTPMYAGVMEEAHERGELPLPRYAPDYIEARTAYSRANWLGPGRGMIDPVKEPQGSVLSMDGALSTLQKEAAENSGMDWEEILDQRQIEVAAFKARGLTVPSWAAMQVPASEAAQPEEEPQPQ